MHNLKDLRKNLDILKKKFQNRNVQFDVNMLPVDSNTPLRNLFKVTHDILRLVNKLARCSNGYNKKD